MFECNSWVVPRHQPEIATVSPLESHIFGRLHTNKAPVTSMRIPSFGAGCASRVETACLTFSKGRDCRINITMTLNIGDR
jgi:hypothetical protein